MKKMYIKALKITYNIIIILSIILLLSVFYSAIFIGKSYSGFVLEPLILILGSILLFFTYKKIYNYIKIISEKKAKILIKIGLALYLIILLAISFANVPISFVDLKDVIEETNHLLINGLDIKNIHYFSMYSNNKTLLIIVYFIYKLGTIINITNLNQFASIINGLCIFTSIYFIVKSVEVNSNHKKALFTLILFIMSPVLFLYAPYYYTDTLVLPIVSIMIYIITLLRAKKTKNNIILLIFLGFYAYIGFKIRATAFFILIAFIIIMLYKDNIKNIIKSIILISLGISLSFSFANYTESIFNFNYQEKDNFPATHWIMMGLNQEYRGRWNAEDVALSQSASTREKRTELNIEEIKKRITEPTTKELIDLFKEKLKINWAYGENSYASYYRMLENYNDTYEYIAGNKQFIIAYILQINRIVLIFMIIITLLLEVKYQKYDYLIVTLFGGLIFYLFWEVYERYSVCFIPIMILISTKYINKIFENKVNKIEITNTEKNEKKTLKIVRITKYIKIAIISYTLFVIIANYNYYTKDEIIINDKVTNTFINWTLPYENKIELNKYTTITQEIKVNKNFNAIKIILFKSDSNRDTYYLKLYHDTGKLLETQTINAQNINNNKLYLINLNSKYQKGNYEIELTTSSKKPISIATTGNKYYNYYKDGKLFLNEDEINEDLVMIVENSRKSTRLPKVVYLLISGLLLLLETFIFIDIKKYFKIKEDK